MTITELAEATGECLAISYSGRADCVGSWACEFLCAQVDDGGYMLSARGYGDTPDCAIKEYVELIRGRKMVFHGHNEDRRVVFAPKTLTVEGAA